jgi:hypothetical protein
VDSPDSILETIARISRRERRLIESFRGEEPRMAAEAEKLTALVDTARALDAASIPYAPIGGLADAMILRAQSFEVAGTSVRVVTREDLVTMKERAAGAPARRRSKRLRDQADIALLEGDVPDPDEGW